MENQLSKQLLLSGNYWVLNKDMVDLLGLETAFLLSNFAEAESIMADKDGWFYQTSETVENITTLSRYKQDKCIKHLSEQGILLKKNKGTPAKRYFKINYKCLTNKFVSNLQTRLRKTYKLDCKKLTTNKESSYKESNYKESNYKESIKELNIYAEKISETQVNKIKQPTIEEIKSYCKERQNSINHEYFY